MKNIHIIPTDKPSRLFKDDFGRLIYSINIDQEQNHFEPQNMYITSDEEIKEGDCGVLGESILSYHQMHKRWGMPQGLKIILTTDQDLIKDGVQAIDDEFLEWFVKNPSCEKVEVGYGWIRLTETDNEGYWVSIPNKQFEMQQEEPKQETLEESAENMWLDPTKNLTSKMSFILGAKWQQERSQKIVPFDAVDIEVFAIKPDEDGKLFAYIGYKIANGNFEFNVVPFTEPQAERMYSQEDILKAYYAGRKDAVNSVTNKLDFITPESYLQSLQSNL